MPTKPMASIDMVSIAMEEVAGQVDPTLARAFMNAVRERQGAGGTGVEYLRTMLVVATEWGSWPLALALERAVARIEATVA